MTHLLNIYKFKLAKLQPTRTRTGGAPEPISVLSRAPTNRLRRPGLRAHHPWPPLSRPEKTSENILPSFG